MWHVYVELTGFDLVLFENYNIFKSITTKLQFNSSFQFTLLCVQVYFLLKILLYTHILATLEKKSI